MNAPMTREEFRAYLAAQLDRDPESLPFDADLRHDTGLDSIEMFLLVVAVEDLGVFFPEELLAHVVTLDDAYHQFVTHAGHR